MASPSKTALTAQNSEQDQAILSNTAVWKGHTDTITSLVISGQYLISGCNDKTVRVWQLSDGQCVKVLGPLEKRIVWVGVLHQPNILDNKIVYVVVPDRVLKIDFTLGVILRELKVIHASNNPSGNVETIRCALIIPPTKLLIGTSDGNLFIYDALTTTLISKHLKSHAGAITSIQHDTLRKLVLTISEDRLIRYWTCEETFNIKSLDLNSFHYGFLHPLCLDVTGGFTFVGTKEKEAVMLSGSGEIATRFGPHITSVTSVKALEGTLITVSGDTATAWSIATGAKIATLDPGQSWITAIELTPQRIFTAGADETIHIHKYLTKTSQILREAVRKREAVIDLSLSQLTALPSLIRYCKNITHLVLKSNGFTSIGKEITTCPLLTRLDLSHNFLSSLPPEFDQLTCLEHLNLNHNQFKTLPLAISGLINLKKLMLEENRLTFLLPLLSSLPLTTLDLLGNPLEDPPSDIISKGVSAIMDYLKSKSSQKECTVGRVKLMLVGNENVGKTSLFLNLRHKSSIFNSRPNIKTLSTTGITIEALQTNYKTSNSPRDAKLAISPQNSQAELKQSSSSTSSSSSIFSKDKKNDRKVKWYTWDFGGQEIYYNTHQFFITPHSIYIIVFDVTKPLDDTNVHFWMRCIQARTSTSRGSHSYSGDSSATKTMVPVLLVGTHIDSFDRSQMPWLKDYFLENSKEKIALLTKKDDAFLETYFTWIFKKYSAEYSNLVYVTGVSCKSGKGIKELKSSLRSLIETNSSIKSQVNAIVYERVFNLENQLLRAKDTLMPPMLSWKEFQLFAKGIIDDQTSLLEATKLLANIGSLVYLPSSSRKNSWLVSLAQLLPEDVDNTLKTNSAALDDELVILDPQWLVDLFATVIGTSPNFVRSGVIKTSDFAMVWKDSTKFPKEIHSRLVHILEHFDVAFSLRSRRRIGAEALNPYVSGLPAPRLKEIASMARQQNATPSLSSISTTSSNNGDDLDSQQPGSHLFPSLLPSGTPKLDLLWPHYEKRFQVDRIYSFPQFLPLGLFSRFLVRLLTYFPSYYYWRQGIVISDDTKRAYALVEELGSQNKVVITVRGAVNAVSPFLTSVMDIWTKLIYDMYDIKVTMSTTCYHCTTHRLENPHIFELSHCEILVSAGERFAQCSNGGTIRLDQLCPELCLVNIRQLEINPNDILPYGTDPPDGGVLGEGGYGVVYRKSFKGKLVAVKKFKELHRQGLLPEDIAKIHTSFRNEIWLMSGASHPNIVKLIGFSLHEESIMVMEYIKGGDLYEAIISSKSLSWPLRFRIALDIARGMAALHSLNPPLCHSDLKCPNCMIVDWNEKAPIVAKVSDFGLSSRLYGDQLTKTPTTNPFWTAPEILAELPFDTSADVYSFGVILWNLVSRKALFEELLPWTQDVSIAVRKGKRPPIPNDAGMPPEWKELIQNCWQHAPSKRPVFSDICLILENMIAKHCPSLMPIVDQTRAEMERISADAHQALITSTAAGNLHGSGVIPNSMVFNIQSSRASQFITNTWAKNLQASDSTVTFFNNSKLANYGTTLLKKMHLGAPISLMCAVGLCQVWIYAPTMSLIHVVNSVGGQFIRSFVAPKDLECMIEVSLSEGSSEVWAGGKNGITIWNSDTGQQLASIGPDLHIKSLLFVNNSHRSRTVWAGLANHSAIYIWGAALCDLAKVISLDTSNPSFSVLPTDSHPASKKSNVPEAITANPATPIAHSSESFNSNSTIYQSLPESTNPVRLRSMSAHSIQVEAPSVKGPGVVSMMLSSRCVWVATGECIIRLSRNTGLPLPTLEEIELPKDPDDIIDSKVPQTSPVIPSCILAHPGNVQTILYSRLKQLWTTGADKTTRVWNTENGALLKTIPNYSPRHLMVVDRTQLWASHEDSSEIDAWSTERFEVVSKIDTEHTKPPAATLLVHNKIVWTSSPDESVHVFI